MEDEARAVDDAGMAPAPTRILLLEANPHAGRRLADSLGAGFDVVQHGTLPAAERELAERPPACVLAWPEAVAALRRLDADVPIVARGEDEPAGADDRIDRSDRGELVARVVRYAIERRGRERRLAHVALHDPLTGLPSRALFADRVGQAFARLQRGTGALTVIQLGVNGFKLVNDSLGHDAGDALLVAL